MEISSLEAMRFIIAGSFLGSSPIDDRQLKEITKGCSREPVRLNSPARAMLCQQAYASIRLRDAGESAGPALS
jgi:hypothetical protein